MDVTLLRTLAVLFDRVRHMQVVWQIFVILLLVFFELLKVLVPLAPDFMLMSTTAAVHVNISRSLNCIFTGLESLFRRIPLY